jgi:hypothetical protein
MKETSQLMDAEECARVWDDQIPRLETRSQLRVTHRMRTKCGEFRCDSGAGRQVGIMVREWNGMASHAPR